MAKREQQISAALWEGPRKKVGRRQSLPLPSSLSRSLAASLRLTQFVTRNRMWTNLRFGRAQSFPQEKGKAPDPTIRSLFAGKTAILEGSPYFPLSSTATATATVAPTMGLLPMPRKPIISTWAGTELEPANWASECMRPMVSVMP